MHLSFRRSNLTLQGFFYVDLGGDLDGRKSTTGYIFTLGGTNISLKSKLQGRVSLSTTEAEYVAILEATKEMIWLKKLLKELRKEQDDSPCLFFLSFILSFIVLFLTIGIIHTLVLTHCLWVLV